MDVIGSILGLFQVHFVGLKKIASFVKQETLPSFPGREYYIDYFCNKGEKAIKILHQLLFSTERQGRWPFKIITYFSDQTVKVFPYSLKIQRQEALQKHRKKLRKYSTKKLHLHLTTLQTLWLYENQSLYDPDRDQILTKNES